MIKPNHVDDSMHILIIEDNPLEQALFQATLKKHLPGSVFTIASSAEEAYELLGSATYDCVLCDYRLPQASGMELLQFMREQDPLGPPVIMLTGMGDERLAVDAMKNGAADYIPKREGDGAPLARSILLAVKNRQLEQELARYQDQLKRLAMTDELTSAGNRASYRHEVRRLFSVYQRSGRGFGLALIDLDKFKPINDQYGHAAGDVVLAEVVRRLQAVIRGGDAVFRLGGDEFGILITRSTSAEAVSPIFRRIELALAQPIKISEDLLVTCGVSIGFAAVPDDAVDEKHLLQKADERMYEMKRARSGGR